MLMDGVITHHEMAPSDEPGKSVLSVKGEDLTRMMDLIDMTGFPYPATIEQFDGQLRADAAAAHDRDMHVRSLEDVTLSRHGG